MPAAPLSVDAIGVYSRLLRARGVAAIAFGLLVFLWPRPSLGALTMLWGGYSLLDGGLVARAAIVGKGGTPRLLLGLVAAAGFTCAAAALARPETVAPLLAGIVSAWAVVTGALQLWAALELRRATVEREWVLALDGIGAIAFGLVLALWPSLEMRALVWLIGWFTILLGALYLAVGVWLKQTE